MPVVRIPTDRITDWATFHDVFASVLGFPDFYGRNMDAWIDCLSYPDSPDQGLMRISVEPGDTLTLDFGFIEKFRARCPEQYAAIVECAAFINAQRIDNDEPAILTLAFR